MTKRDAIDAELVDLANALKALKWRHMTKVSEHLVDQLPHLRQAERLDRDGLAQILSEMAEEILAEFNAVSQDEIE